MHLDSLPSRSTRPAPSSLASSPCTAVAAPRRCGAVPTSNSRSCAVNGPKPSAAYPLTSSKPFSIDSKKSSQPVTPITTGQTLRECSPCSMTKSAAQLTGSFSQACPNRNGAKNSAAPLAASPAKRPLPSFADMLASSKIDRSHLTNREIALEYQMGRRMQVGATQLTQKSLAKKFDRAIETVSKIAHYAPCSVPKDEQITIRACITEGKQMKAEASKRSMPNLCQRYRVGYKAIERELELMGAREVSL